MDPEEISVSIWRFITQLYEKPGVEPLCLQLQNNFGASVVLVLWSQWLESQGAFLTSELLAKAGLALKPWQGKLTELRQLRREIKKLSIEKDSGFEAYNFLKQAEIAMERELVIELASININNLQTKLPSMIQGGAGQTGQNVSTYLNSIGVKKVEEEWLKIVSQV